MNEGIARVKSMETHALNRAVEHLMGMLQGVMADGVLQDAEVRFLRTWITEHEAVTRTWPGSLVRRQLDLVLEDGVISNAEREHLINTFTHLIGTNFSLTGSSSPEIATLPINDSVTVDLRHSGVCHTGEFLFGTRATCERATLKAGGMPLDSLTKSVDYLVIGTRVSPSWAHTSFGRKIQRAVELQDAGHAIEIISEQRWIGSMS